MHFKKRLFLVLQALFIFTGLAFLIASCSKTNFKVRFDPNGGKLTCESTVMVESGEKLKRPTDPIKDDYIFNEWQLDGKAYNFNEPVKSNFTLVANWKDKNFQTVNDPNKKVKVTIDLGYENKKESVEAIYGSTLNKPANPYRQGYNFIGWFLDNKEYDFNKKLDSNITLKAKWEIKKFTVTFDLNEGKGNFGNQKVEYGKQITKPNSIPTKDGYRFIGWYYGESKYDFTSKVKSDIKLVVKWTDGYVLELQEGLTLEDKTINPLKIKANTEVVILLPDLKYCDCTKLSVNGNDKLNEIKNGKLTLIIKEDTKVDATFVTKQGFVKVSFDTDGLIVKDSIYLEKGKSVSKRPKFANYKDINYYVDNTLIDILYYKFYEDKIVKFKLEEKKTASDNLRARFEIEDFLIPVPGKKLNHPNRVVVTVNGDPRTRMGFNWITTDETNEAKVWISTSSDMKDAKIFNASSRKSSEDDICKILRVVRDSNGYFNKKKKIKFEETSFYIYSALATNLKPNTEYFYQVGSLENGFSKSPIGTFITAGNPGKEFEFVHYTDTQNKYKDQFAFDEAWYGADTLRRILDVSPNAKFVVHTGDIVEYADIEDEWYDLFEKSKDSFMRNVLVPISGNHDELSRKNGYGMNSPFVDHFNVEHANNAVRGGAYYSFMYNGVYMAVLNSNDYYEGPLFSEEQINWFIDDVKKARQKGAKWIMVAFHKAFHSKAYHSTTDPEILAGKEKCMKIFDELG